MNQTQQILEHLQKVGSITPLQALNKYGCMRLGARIYDLRMAGWPIMRTIENHTNNAGETKRYARYWMKGS